MDVIDGAFVRVAKNGVRTHIPVGSVARLMLHSVAGFPGWLSVCLGWCEALELLIRKKPLGEFTRQEDVTAFSDSYASLLDTLISTPFFLKYLTLVEEK